MIFIVNNGACLYSETYKITLQKHIKDKWKLMQIALVPCIFENALFHANSRMLCNMPIWKCFVPCIFENCMFLCKYANLWILSALFLVTTCNFVSVGWVLTRIPFTNKLMQKRSPTLAHTGRMIVLHRYKHQPLCLIGGFQAIHAELNYCVLY